MTQLVIRAFKSKFCLLAFPVIERFCLPPDAKVAYKDGTDTEVDEEIFSDLIKQGNVVLKVYCHDGEI